MTASKQLRGHCVASTRKHNSGLTDVKCLITRLAEMLSSGRSSRQMFIFWTTRSCFRFDKRCYLVKVLQEPSQYGMSTSSLAWHPLFVSRTLADPSLQAFFFSTPGFKDVRQSCYFYSSANSPTRTQNIITACTNSVVILTDPTAAVRRRLNCILQSSNTCHVKTMSGIKCDLFQLVSLKQY